MSSSTEQPSSSLSGAEEVERASAQVLEYLKTFMRGNTKQKTKNVCIEELLKLFRRYPSLINCRYTIKKGQDQTPLWCFMLQNKPPLTTIQELIGTSTDVATTVSMYSGAGGHIPMNFACKTGQSDLMILLATSSPKLVTSKIFDKFFLLQRGEDDDDEEEEMHNDACSVEMLQQLLDINPTANVSDEFVDRALSYNNNNNHNQAGSIPLNLLEKLIDNCTQYGLSLIRINESYSSLEAIPIVCKIFQKIVSNKLWIQTTSLKWDSPTSFLHLVQKIESNNTTLKYLKLWVPDISGNSETEDLQDQVQSAMKMMMANNTMLKDLTLHCSSDVESTHFWVSTALRALPSVNDELNSLVVNNDMGFSVLIEAEAAAAASVGGKLPPSQPTSCLQTSPTTVFLPIKYLSQSQDSIDIKNNNILLDFVGETLPTMCSLQRLRIYGTLHGAAENVCSSCKETTTRIITTLLRNASSSKLEEIKVFDYSYPNRQPSYKGIRIDLADVAKALENNTGLQKFSWNLCNQEISQEEIEAMRDVLKDHNSTIMQFNIVKASNSNNLEYSVDPQISYYVDLNWCGRSKLVRQIAYNNNNGGAAVEDLIGILTCLKNRSISRDRTGAKKLGIWYGLLREAPAVWSSSNNLTISRQGRKDGPPHHRKRKRGEA